MPENDKLDAASGERLPHHVVDAVSGWTVTATGGVNQHQLPIVPLEHAMGTANGHNYRNNKRFKNKFKAQTNTERYAIR